MLETWPETCSIPTRRAWLGGAAMIAAGATLSRAASAQPRTASLLVLEKADQALSLYDLSTGVRTSRLVLPGSFPHEFALDPTGRHAYVAHYGAESSTSPGEGGHAVYVVDLAASTLVRALDCQPYGRLHGIRTDARGRLLVLSEARDTLLGFDDPPRAAAPERAVFTGAIKSHLFALTRDGARAYVSGLLSNTVTLVRPDDPASAPLALATGARPEGSALSADEATLIVANRGSRTLVAVDAASLTAQRRVPSRGDVVRLAPLPDGRFVSANLSERSLSLLRADLTETGVIPLDGAPQSLSLHPSRLVAYAALDGSRVAVVDLERLTVEGHLTTGAGPDVTQVLAAA